jgi:chromosome partitioning related protein ParA
MIVFTVMSTKGGEGKTTTAANLGGIFADMGLRVLFVDTDGQPSLSKYYHCAERAPNGLTQLVMSGRLTPDCISILALSPEQPTLKRLPKPHPDGCLHLVASDDPEGRLQLWMGTRPHSVQRFRRALRNPWVAENYDIVIIDTQGAVGFLQDAAILAADQLIAPVGTTVLSAREFTTRTQELLDRLDPGIEEDPPILTGMPPVKAILYRVENTTDSKVWANEIRKKFVDLQGRVTVLETAVPKATAYTSAASAMVPVHWYDPGRQSHVMHQLAWELVPSLAGVYGWQIEQAAAEDQSDASLSPAADAGAL